MKHLLMHPAFPDIVGECAFEEISDQDRVWTVTRGADGKLTEELDLALLLKLNPDHSALQIADALVLAAAAADIADTRVW